MLTAGPPPVLINWKLLRQLDMKTGKRTPELEKANGAAVRILGFMVPFDDEEQKTTEFLLVPVMGQCVHLPPPPPNQIVLVRMANRQLTKVWYDDMVSVEGQLEIADGKSPYGDVSFQMTSTKVAKEER